MLQEEHPLNSLVTVSSISSNTELLNVCPWHVGQSVYCPILHTAL
jgi:hypothetical protein